MEITVGYAWAADWYWAGYTGNGEQLYIDNASVTRNAATAYVWTKMVNTDGTYNLIRYRVDKGTKRLGIVEINVYNANNVTTFNWKAANDRLIQWIDISPESGAERIYNLTWGSDGERALKTYLWNLKQFRNLLHKTYLEHEIDVEKLDTPEKIDALIRCSKAMIDNLDNLHVPTSAREYHSLEKEKISLVLKILTWMKANNIISFSEGIKSEEMKMILEKINAIDKKQRQIRKPVENLP